MIVLACPGRSEMYPFGSSFFILILHPALVASSERSKFGGPKILMLVYHGGDPCLTACVYLGTFCWACRLLHCCWSKSAARTRFRLKGRTDSWTESTSISSVLHHCFGVTNHFVVPLGAEIATSHGGLRKCRMAFDPAAGTPKFQSLDMKCVWTIS